MSDHNLFTIKGFADKHQAFTVSGLRDLRFYCAENGFADAFLTMGRKVLIDEGVFFECLRRNSRRRSA